MPVPTDQLADEIHDLRRDFNDFRVDVAQRLGAINVDIGGKLSTINATLEGFRGRVETKLAVAQWVATVSVPIIVGLVGWAFVSAQRATRLEDSIVASAQRAEHIEESVIALRDAIKMREMREKLENPVRSPVPKDEPPPNHPIGQLPPGGPNKDQKP
jgi:hypothetical protein